MRSLKIESLESKGWIDRDVIMLHACFQLLKDCVEKEHVDTHMNYDAHKETVDEIRFLYNWWIEKCKIPFEESLLQDEEDDAMLMRLMKIRQTLWT